MRHAIRRTCGAMLAAALGLGTAGCPPPPPPAPAPAALPLQVGVEYAPPGMAAALAGTRLGAAKLFPDLYTWGDMQPAPGARIRFELLDRMVREYQDAGVTRLTIALRSQSPWGVRDPLHNHAPKPEHLGAYAAWIGAVVERYDGDGNADLPGLRAPVDWIEIGVEFSSFEPEPAADYLGMLETAYAAAHAASESVVVLHAAFLTTGAFDESPGPDGYEAAFAAMPARIAYHTLGGMRAILDRPDLFDAVNAHALGSPYELPHLVRWLRHEMEARGYAKPIAISDTTPYPFIAWGPASVCTGTPDQLGIVLWPAAEADRCAIADHFDALLAGNPDALAWTRAHAARDMIKRIAIAAAEGVAWINAAFMEDLKLLQWPPLQAGAGASAWAGMADTAIDAATEQRRVTALHPLYYALRQFADAAAGAAGVVREEAGDPGTWLYRLAGLEPAAWIAWHEPQGLLLPGIAPPTRTVNLAIGSEWAEVAPLIDAPGQTHPDTYSQPAPGGTLRIALGPRPLFLRALPPDP